MTTITLNSSNIVGRSKNHSVGFEINKSPENSSMDSPKENVVQNSGLDDKQDSTSARSSRAHYTQRNSYNTRSNYRGRQRDYVQPPRFSNAPWHFDPTLAHGPPFYGPHAMGPYNYFPTMMQNPDYNPAMAFGPPLRTPANVPYYHVPMRNNVQDCLESKIVRQINYYFSKSNLVRDTYLRSKMDDDGWVPISVIASFPRVKQLTESIPLILKSLASSYAVVVEGDKIRKRYNGKTWVLPPHLLPNSSVESARTT